MRAPRHYYWLSPADAPGRRYSTASLFLFGTRIQGHRTWKETDEYVHGLPLESRLYHLLPLDHTRAFRGCEALHVAWFHAHGRKALNRLWETPEGTALRLEDCLR